MSERFPIAGLLAVAAAILLWRLSSDRHDTAEVSRAGASTETAAASAETGSKATPSAQDLAGAPPIKPQPPSSRPEDSRATGALPATSNPETTPEAGNPIENYLTRHERDARSLLQAFRATRHRDYLNEALTRFPNDPLVLFHSVLYDTDPTDERKAMLLNLQELLPGDAVPCYLLGEQLLQEGDRNGALERLMEGSLKPHANNYASEMISDAQEFLVASGIAPGDALGQASFNVEMRLLEPLRRLISTVQDIHTDISARGDGDNSAEAWAIAGASLAQSMHEQMSHTLIENLFAISMEEKFLSLLPPETELVAGGSTVAQRTREIKEFRAIVQSFERMCDAGFGLPEAEKLAFFKRLQEEGEFSALLWLNGRNQERGDELPNK